MMWCEHCDKETSLFLPEI